MAIVLTIQKWRHYLIGQQFTVFTDQRVADKSQQKWLSKLLGYNFEIKYKARPENRVADALSKTFHFSFSFPMAAEWEDLEAKVLANGRLKGIMQ